MIVGSGMMARAFQSPLTGLPSIVIHAAGVSNSSCSDPREFERERTLLQRSLAESPGADCLVYFSTCSIDDPGSTSTPYVRHKVAMETLVRAHPRHLIFRLPQVAGHTPNPHTLLNYLYARIARGERFSIWRDARRNVIDCNDVKAIGLRLIEHGVRAETVNIACSHDHSVAEIVDTMERVVSGHAVYDVLNRGCAYEINIARIRPFLSTAGVLFEENYLDRVIRRYYGMSS